MNKLFTMLKLIKQSNFILFGWKLRQCCHCWYWSSDQYCHCNSKYNYCWKLWQVLETFVAPHQFCMIFENATIDKTVQFHPVCLKFEPLLFLVCIDVAIGFNIAKKVFWVAFEFLKSFNSCCGNSFLLCRHFSPQQI